MQLAPWAPHVPEQEDVQSVSLLLHSCVGGQGSSLRTGYFSHSCNRVPGKGLKTRRSDSGSQLAHIFLTLASRVQRDGKVMAVAVGGHSWDLVSKREAETDEQ